MRGTYKGVFIHDDHREFCGQCAAPSARTAL